MWFEENFAELANKLIEANLANKIYLIASQKNQNVVKKIINLSNKNNFLDCSSLNLLQVIKVIKYSNYFVGNNSGPLNLASALGVKAFGLIANDRVSELKNSNIIPILPKNYKNEYIGEVTLREAFSKSINTVAVKISETIGRDKVINIAKSMGITSPILNSPSLALGTSEVTLLELTSAYNVLANNGNGVFSYGIRSIEDTDGEILFSRKFQGSGKVLESSTVGKMTRMMEQTIESGTGKNAKLNRPAAGKTGTSQSLRDAWFIGFTSNIVVGVWFGNDNDSPMKQITGGTAPAILWKEFMTAAHQDIKPRGLSYDPDEPKAKNLNVKAGET